MRAELFLAGRYLKPQRNAVGVITIISIIGVALGVAVLIIVLAVMTGFTDLMKEKLLDTQAHLQVHSRYAGGIRKPRTIVEQIEKLGGSAAPIVSGQAMAQVRKNLDPTLYVLGAKSEDLAKQMKVGDALQNGSFDLKKGDIVISSDMALRWKVWLGDKILLHSPNKLTDMVTINPEGNVALNEENPVYLPSEFTVAGIYSFNKSDFDRSVVFLNFDDAASLFDLKWGTATSIYAWIDNPMNAEVFAENLKKATNDPTIRIASWQQMNSALLGVLAVEKRMMFFLLIFIVLVAAFSITNTLITSVYKKTREIGILKALGATDGAVMRIFIFQGMLVGIVGSVAGTLLGFLVIFFRDDILAFGSKITGQELFPKEFYYFNGLPAHIVSSDVLLIVCISIVLCTIGGIIPATRAAKLDPAKALRYE